MLNKDFECDVLKKVPLRYHDSLAGNFYALASQDQPHFSEVFGEKVSYLQGLSSS